MGFKIDQERVRKLRERNWIWPRYQDKQVRRIPKDELQHALKDNTQFALEQESVSEEVRDRFLDKHVTGYTVNGMRVLLVDHEHDRPMRDVALGQLHPAAKALIDSEQTYAVGVEYFLPELRRNARQIPHIGPSVITSSEKKLPLTFAKVIAQDIAQAQKPLFVADPADRANVALPHFVLPWAATAEVAIGVIGNSLHIPFIPDILKSPGVILPALLYLEAHQKIRKIGMDHKKLHPLFQRFGMTIDDSRRLFVAAGIKQLVRDIQKQDPQSATDKQLVVVYPKAHTQAIGDYLEHPHVIKRLLYRLRVDVPRKLRVFLPDNRVKGIQIRDIFDGWKRTINQNLPLVG